MGTRFVTRSTAAVLCVALLTVAAGCSGLSPGDGTTTQPPADVPDTTPSETTATTTMTERTTPEASRAFRRAVTNHSMSLRAAGQFVVRTTSHAYRGQREANRTSPTNHTHAADLTVDRYWSGVRMDPADGVYDAGLAYQDGTALYHRDELPNGSVVYRRVHDPEEVRPTPRSAVLDWLRTVPNASVHFPFERNGTATFEGKELARYTVTEPGSVGCLATDGLPGGMAPGELRNVTGFNATALVDDRGIVRQFECTLTGYLYTDVRYSERISWTVSGIGTVTLRPPERLVNVTDSRET